MSDSPVPALIESKAVQDFHKTSSKPKVNVCLSINKRRKEENPLTFTVSVSLPVVVVTETRPRQCRLLFISIWHFKHTQSTYLLLNTVHIRICLEFDRFG